STSSPPSTLFPYTTLFRSLLKSLIRQTVFAISTMETRPILTGVNVQLIDSTLTFTATDGHRLASRNISLENTDINIPSAVIPGSDRKSTRLNSSHVSISYA